MSPAEFKQLNNKFITTLQEKLPNNTVKVVNNPFQGTVVGISYEKGGNLFEIYQLSNDGNVAEYKYLGDGQL